MKKNIFLTFIFTLCCFFAAEAQSQKKATYIKDLTFTFNASGSKVLKRKTEESSWIDINTTGYEKCEFEGGLCEMRATISVNNNKLEVMGNNSTLMSGTTKDKISDSNKLIKSRSVKPYTTGTFKTKDNKESLYLGEFTPDEKFEIKFDIWEDDDFFGNGWIYDGSDDDHEDTITKSSASTKDIQYVTKGKGCLLASYTIYQE